jgi:hypothetical protein
MMSLWDALRMNMMISYQELVRTFPKIHAHLLFTLTVRLDACLKYPLGNWVFCRASMTSLKKYHQHKDKWWALPLVLPCLLLPLFNLANTYTHVAGETVVLSLCQWR